MAKEFEEEDFGKKLFQKSINPAHQKLARAIFLALKMDGQ